MGNHSSAYFIFDVVIHDEAALKPYLDNVAASYKAFGGKRIVMGGECQTIEGNAPAGHLVILQFDNIEQAQAWHDSPAYQAILPFRLNATTTHAWLVEGIAPEFQ